MDRTSELSARRLLRVAAARHEHGGWRLPAPSDGSIPRAYWREPVSPVRYRAELKAYATAARPRRRSGAGKFVIFALGRTGSTLLVDLLNRSLDVHCDGEILTRGVVLPTAWVTAHRRRHPDRVYGFKVKVDQLLQRQHLSDPADWLGGMHRRGWRVIHLRRRNLLRHVLSNTAASERGRYHERAGESPATHRALRIDPMELMHWLGVRAWTRDEERRALADVPHEKVCYEDDLLEPERHQATLDRLSAVLGVAPGRAATTLRPTNQGRLEDLVANYAEVARALAGTPYEAYLD